MSWRIAFVLAIALAAGAAPQSPGAARALTADEQTLGFERTPPRLSLTDGAISFFRAGSEEWTPAEINTPLAAGDLLYADEGSNFELQVGPRTFVRAGEKAELGLTTLEPDFLQLRITAGTVALDLRTLSPGQSFELDTPNAAFKIEQPGFYRIAIGDDVTAFTTRRGGLASATVATGETVQIAANEQLQVHGTLQPEVQTYAAPDLDSWDRWNYARSEPREGVGSQSASYVPADVYGAQDLDRYGDWQVEPTYGPVWYARGVGPGWVPYSNGRWISDPYYGWTWVDAAPWGWAPFHYGRWVYIGGRWGWCPGPRVHAYYAPALVAFYGSPPVSLGYASYGAPSVGWVALGWGEPVYPWWGPTWFRAQPYWIGWGGSHHHWDDHDDHHGHDGHGGDGHGGGGGDGHQGGGGWAQERQRWTNHGGRYVYDNSRVKGAIVSVDRDHFGRPDGSRDFRRAKSEELEPLRDVASALPDTHQRPDGRDSQRTRRDADRPAARFDRDRPGTATSRGFAPPTSRDATQLDTPTGRGDMRPGAARHSDRPNLDRGHLPATPRTDANVRRNPPGFTGDQATATRPPAPPRAPRDRQVAPGADHPSPPRASSRPDRPRDLMPDRTRAPRPDRAAPAPRVAPRAPRVEAPHVNGPPAVHAAPPQSGGRSDARGMSGQGGHGAPTGHAGAARGDGGAHAPGHAGGGPGGGINGLGDGGGGFGGGRGAR
jgi:hypothetical protein